MPVMKAPPRIHAVDLFCGIGGLTYGLGLSGVEVKAGFDIDESCRHAYEANNRGSEFVAADVRDIGPGHIAPYYADADVSVLVGCAPCQPFSAHTRKLKRDADCSLIRVYADLVEEVRPDVVSMENVPGLVRHEAFGDFLAALERSGYWWRDWAIVPCADYGVPQSRRRLVLLASKLGDISLPKPERRRRTTVADFIQCLPPIGDGEAHPGDPAHVALTLSDTNKRRIRQSRPGGSWKDWDDDIVSACHRESYYPAPYGRMSWDGLAPTITTQFCYYSTGRFGHPEQDRAISVRLREGASGVHFRSPLAPRSGLGTRHRVR